MTLIVATVLYPLLLAALCAGVGLALERAAAVQLPGPLLVPFGFAAGVGITQLSTFLDATAELSLPLLVVVALAGAWLGRPRLIELWARRGSRRREALWPALAALGAYLCLAAPVILSGHPTWAAYGVDTTAPFHWLGAEQLATNGRNFDAASPSAANNVMAGYFDHAYPSGGNTLLGVTAQGVGLQVAWLWQPFLAFAAGLLALVLYGLVRPLVRAPLAAAAIAFVAAQPAMFVAFALQGMIKEILGTVFVPLVALAAWLYVRNVRSGWRAALPLAVAGAAGAGVNGLAFGLWLGPAALFALLLAWWRFPRHDRRPLAGHVLAFGLAFAVLSVPALTGLSVYIDSVSGLLTKEVPLGSLLEPLSPFQAAGVWLSGDYRLRPGNNLGTTYALIGVGLAGMLISLEWLARQADRRLLAYAALSVPAFLIILRRGTPWVDAKAFTVLSPLCVTLALLVAVALRGTTARLAGVGAALLVAGGVLVSNALMYHDTQLASYDRYRELAGIAERFDGKGPTLRPDFDDYANYFAEPMQPDSPADARPAVAPGVRKGLTVGYGRSQRLDDLQLAYVESFPTILLHRSPFESRPPANYRRVYVGRWYEVWQRGPGAVIEHLPAGDRWSARGRAGCGEVRDLARLARARGGQLAVSERGVEKNVVPAELPHPGRWVVADNDPRLLVISGPGRLGAPFRVERDGRYSLWLSGSFPRRLSVLVDGRNIGAVGPDVRYDGLAQRVGAVELTAGRHRVEIRRGGGSLAPGNGASATLGPLAVTNGADVGAAIRYVRPEAYRELCGREVDWIEVVRGVSSPTA